MLKRLRTWELLGPCDWTSQQSQCGDEGLEDSWGDTGLRSAAGPSNLELDVSQGWQQHRQCTDTFTSRKWRQETALLFLCASLYFLLGGAAYLGREPFLEMPTRLPIGVPFSWFQTQSIQQSRWSIMSCNIPHPTLDLMPSWCHLPCRDGVALKELVTCGFNVWPPNTSFFKKK